MTTTFVVLLAIAIAFYGASSIGGLIAIVINGRAMTKTMEFLDAYMKPLSVMLNRMADEMDDK